MAISQGFMGKYCYPEEAGKSAACIENLKFDAAECGANGDSALFLYVENFFLIENCCKHSAPARNRLKENVKLLILKGGDFRVGCPGVELDPNTTPAHLESPPYFAIPKGMYKKCMKFLPRKGRS